MSSFKPAGRQRVGEEVARQLRAMILDGRFGPGDKLPPERSLAELLQVNRTSVREGLKALEHSGLVTIRQGDGTRVLDYRKSAGLELLGHLLAHDHRSSAGGASSLGDVLEFRQALGRELARIAAERATPEQIAALEQVVATAPASAEEALQQDFEFYDRLNPGNLVFQLILNSVRPAVNGMSRVLADFNPPPADVAAHHREVIAAIKARDPEAAYRAADDHLRRGKEHLLKKWGLSPSDDA